MAGAPAYSLEALRQHREAQKRSAEPPAARVIIPDDVEMDPGLVLGCWNGERFVSWETWMATEGLGRKEPERDPYVNARLAYAVCGETRVWLEDDGERWFLYEGSRRRRRKDFASPCLEHAQRCAEARYGPARNGWRVETKE